MYLLGISAFYHDSAAALIENDKIIAAAQEERFTRKKHDAGFPSNAVKYCLAEAAIDPAELAAIVFYDKPLLKFERLLETYYAFAPKGLKSFLMSMPVWIKEKMFLKKLIRDELKKVIDLKHSKIPLLFPEHHLSHAASAFYPSAFEEAAILTIDGVGEWATTTICHGKGKDISILRELRFPHSVGLLYSAFTYYTGFKVNSGEYKLMGLAPYGNKNSSQTKKFYQLICDELADIKEDGSVWLNQDYFDYATGLKMTADDKWQQLFGLPVRKPESELTQSYCDLALAIQNVTEEIVLKLARHAKEITGSKNLCMAGGVALNCVANGKILREKIFDRLYFQPAAGDAGGALGAALAAFHIHFGKERNTDYVYDTMCGSYLGPEFSDKEIIAVAKKFKAAYESFQEFDDLAERSASLLADGKVVGWFQGRMEWGPRALGNRSILGDARNPEMQKKLNLKIKYRESFRPFAPAVLSEDCNDYFDLGDISPYMLLVDSVKKERQKCLPEGFDELPLKEKLYFLRSDIPAVTHLDYSARIQTVHHDTNERFWKLIVAFKRQTGFGLIVNTSFNVRGEPIVCTPEDAYKCMMRTEMDYLVMGNFLFDKSKQPDWNEDDDWRKQFTLD
ncbi:MAG: carbamoyltransferase [Bacteroidetes bacterium]|nr:carbamoyltransferase [Bacteroidota bacterium]